MTAYSRRLLSVTLILALLLTMLPSGLETASAASSRGIVTGSSVHVRKQPSTSAEIWFDLMQNAVCTITNEVTSEGIHWYRVETTHPETRGSTSIYIGYIHGDFFRRMTDAEDAAYTAAQQQAAATPTPGPAASNVDTQATSGSIGVVTNGGTNFREGPSTHAHSLMKLDRGTEVELITIPSVISSETFYEVRYQGQTGYIMSTFIRVASGGSAVTATPASGAAVTATPTPAPTSGGSGSSTTTTTTTKTSYSGYTHVRLILSSCHLRETPNGNYDSGNDWEERGASLPLNGNPVTSGGYTWYPVLKNGKQYYVRNDCVQPYSANTATATPSATGTATATATPAADTNALGYVITTMSNCNLRATMGGTVIKQVAKNREFPYLQTPTQKGNYTWYYVDADGTRGYLRSDVVRVVSSTSTSTSSTTTTTTTTTATESTVSDSNAIGYVKTTAGGVNLRVKPGYTDVKGRVDRDVVMPYYSTTTAEGITWYYVLHSSLGYGYLHGSYVTKTDSSGNSEATATPAVTGSTGTTTTTTSTSSSQQEASYTTLKLGSTGTAVKNLVTELKNQGYYNGDITSRYTSSVETAVKNFQRSNNLSVDGIAGAATQHKLYGTVPVGAADTSNLTMTLYPAEKIDWYTGGINEMWARGANYKVYDVKTGIVWWAHRWAGGKHVDAEPLTAADTARLCKCYGVTTASEITAKRYYQRRPLLVTIGTRTFACSLYGVPHNYPDGDTISDNAFKGQVCIHFTNSRTHDSNKVDSGHVEAIQYAWEHCPAGHK